MRIVKSEFADAYVSLVIEAGDKDISVVDLTTRMGCARKTFYRYFDDIDDLVIWYYRDAMRQAVETLPDAIPVKPDPALHDKYADWPFYARIPDERCGLDQSRYMVASASHFEANAGYYAAIFRNSSARYRDFRLYLRNLFTYALRDDIVYMLAGRMVPAQHIQFLAEYHAAAIVGRLDQFISERRGNMAPEDELHWNYAHQAISRDIESYFAQARAVRPASFYQK